MQQRKKITLMSLLTASIPLSTFAATPIIEHDEANGEITVWAEDRSYSITLQDKNLWATEVWNGEDSTGNPNKASYGYHYQWGNNHGFAPCTDADGCTTFPGGEWTGNTKADTSSNGPTNPYNNATWITVNPRDDPANLNLRWGSGDNSSNNYGYDKTTHTATNVEARQGPCAEGYHVPSEGELRELDTLMGDMDSLEFIKALKLPFAGSRDYSTAEVRRQGDNGYYWSSSPYSTNDSWLLYVDRDGYFYPIINNTRAYGQSVRCFKNSLKNPPKTSSLSLSASSWDLVASEEVSFSNGVVSYTQSVRDAIQSIREFLQLSEKYIIEWYQTNAQGEKEVVEIESINSTESMALSGTVKKKWMCKPPAHYHGEGN